MGEEGGALLPHAVPHALTWFMQVTSSEKSFLRYRATPAEWQWAATERHYLIRFLTLHLIDQKKRLQKPAIDVGNILFLGFLYTINL
jgi:hypothetical protein